MSRAEWIIVALISGDILVGLVRLASWMVNQHTDATYLMELRKLGATVLEATKIGPVIVQRAEDGTPSAYGLKACRPDAASHKPQERPGGEA